MDAKAPKCDLHWFNKDVEALFWKTEGDLDIDYGRELNTSGGHLHHEIN